MAGVNDSELLAALRICSGKKKEVREFQAGGLLDRATSEFPEFCQGVESRGLDTAMPEFAVALAAGYVKQCLSLGDPGETFESSVGRSKLGDVAFAALCARGDKAATNSFVEYVGGNFLSWMLKTRGSHPQQDVWDVVNDLASHCFEATREWLLAGRPRLVQYSGKSTLKVWLMTIVDAQLIDRRRRSPGRTLSRKSEDDSTAAIDSLPDPRSLKNPSAADLLAVDQSPTSLIRQAMREVAAELLNEHRNALAKGESSTQYRFFVLRYLQGRAPGEIADELGISPSRVTELANRVADRLVQRIHALGQSDSRPALPLGREQRQTVELCAREILCASDDSCSLGPQILHRGEQGGAL